MINKIILFISLILIIPHSFSSTVNCPKHIGKPKESDINLCIFNALNENRSPTTDIQHDAYIKMVRKVLFEYFDTNENDSIEYLELKNITLFKPSNKDLKVDLKVMSENIFKHCVGKNNKTFENCGFEVKTKKDFTNKLNPDELKEYNTKLLVALLSATESAFKFINKIINHKKEKVISGDEILGLSSVALEYWNNYFDVGKSIPNQYIKQRSIISKYEQIVKSDKKKIEEKASAQKSIIRGEEIGTDDKWQKVFSVGDKFEDRFTKDFANPAKLLFEKSAGEESKESLNVAFRFDIQNVSEGENKHWRYSVGHSIEKSTKKGVSKDIRGYHYSQDKTYDAGNVQLSLSALDNFAGGNESWVGKISYSPKYNDKGNDKGNDKKKSNKALKDNCEISKNSNTWLDLPISNCEEIVLNKWQFFYTPFIEIEKNEITQKPNDPTVLFNDDADYLIFRLETGLKKGQFEFKYSGTRRFNIGGAKHLSYQEISTDFYFDKKKHFSIGITAKIGQRPIDLKSVEDYELGFGYSL